MDKTNSDKDTDSGKDDGKVISVSPGKQYVRGETQSEKRMTALNAVGSSIRKQGELLRKSYSPENSAETSKALKGTDMLFNAYDEESKKGFKKGGLVRGAGLAQRGQGKMRMC
jgi:hypothetical protein